MPGIDEQNQQQRTLEDGPEYRSVAIRTSAPPNMRRLFQPLEKGNKSLAVVDRSCSRSEV